MFDYDQGVENEGQIELDDDPDIREREVTALRGRFGGDNAVETCFLAERAWAKKRKEEKAAAKAAKAGK